MSGHNVFNTIVDYFDAVKSSYKLITPTEFADWKRQYTFDGLKGIRYGQSFCNHFSITDNILYYSLTPEQADIYIEELYIERS